MKVLNNTVQTKENYNGRSRNKFPLYGKCLTKSIIYEAQLTSFQPNYKENICKFTTMQNHSASNTMKTTRSYLKNTGQKMQPFHSKNDMENNKDTRIFQHNQ